MIYREYGNFRNDKFRIELDNDILKCILNDMEYQHFLNLFIEILSRKRKKENKDLISYFLHYNFNKSLSCSTFPTTMKYVDVRPIHNNDGKNNKEIIGR